MRIRLGFFGCFLPCLIAAAYAQPSNYLDSQLLTVTARLSNPNLATREAAFEELREVISRDQKRPGDYSEALNTFIRRHPAQADGTKLSLIRLLEIDNKAFTDPHVVPGSYTEADMEHYAAAIEVVSSLNDERAIPALIGAMPYGDAAATNLVKFGERALNPVLRELTNPDATARASAVSLAITILRNMNNGASREQIIQITQNALVDSEFLVRSSALSAIEASDEKGRFGPALQEMAIHDPFKVPGQSEYPLRIRATKLLEESRNR